MSQQERITGEAVPHPTYEDGRTKQSFKDETDINKILARAQKTGTISHLAKYEGQYADFSDFDFFESQIKLAQGREIFDALPSEIRNEFRNSQADFFAYVNDPANKDRLKKLLPALAAPGRQNIDVTGKSPPDDPPAPADDPPAPTATATVADTTPPPAAPTPPPAAPADPPA